jgi:hypothetical protein
MLWGQQSMCWGAFTMSQSLTKRSTQATRLLEDRCTQQSSSTSWPNGPMSGSPELSSHLRFPSALEPYQMIVHTFPRGVQTPSGQGYLRQCHHPSTARTQDRTCSEHLRCDPLAMLQKVRQRSIVLNHVLPGAVCALHERGGFGAIIFCFQVVWALVVKRQEAYHHLHALLDAINQFAHHFGHVVRKLLLLLCRPSCQLVAQRRS